MRSAVFSYEGQEANLCQCRTHAHLEEEEQEGEDILCSGSGVKKLKTRRLVLDPVQIEFEGFSFKVQTTVSFKEGDSSIAMTRRVYDFSDPEAKIGLKEYMTACYGTTEYAQDMTGITLGIDGEADADGRKDQRFLEYLYKDRNDSMKGAQCVWASVPQIDTRVSMDCSRKDAEGYIEEGYAFSPMFTLGYRTELSDGEEVATWLRLAKEN